jgi:glutathione S-transferase
LLAYLLARKHRPSAEDGIKLTYFSIQGAAEGTRLALVLTGTPFTDERLTFDAWKERKPTTRYGQVPYMTRGGREYYQSGAMLRWVGSRCGDGSLYPIADPELAYDIDEMLGLCDDLQRAWTPCVYVGMRPSTYGHPEDWPKEQKDAAVRALRERFVNDPEALSRFMGYFSARLEKTPFLCGTSPTIADCRLLPQLRYWVLGKADGVPTDVLAPYTHVVAWIDRMMAIPSIAGWYSIDGH